MSRIGCALIVGFILISVGIAFVINILNPWPGIDVGSLWFFVIGCILFPGVFRRYRADRRGEREIFWYCRLICLIWLEFGFVFAMSVVQKWVDSVSLSLVMEERILRTLGVAEDIVLICVLALGLFMFAQIAKEQTRNKKTPPPSSNLVP